MDFETCYAYKPSARNKNSRPSKKRRVESPQGLQTSWPLRRSLYERLWSEQHARLKSLLLEINQTTIDQISSFVDSTDLDVSPTKVSSAIILTGPSIASHALLFSQLSERITTSETTIFISLTSSLAPNLKTLLKNLIQKGTSADALPDDEDDVAVTKTTRKRNRLSNYDLQLLYDYVQERKLSRVVVAFQDCEAFDGPLLSDTIELLSRWQDRIPLVFFFGVATSIENFQSKLSKKATRCVQGQRFDVVKAESALERITDTLYSGSPCLWMGAGICSTTLRRQREHIQSLDAFVDSVQYAYLSHFYANALSIFLDEDVTIADVSKEHFEALRNLSSFQEHVHTLLNEGETTLVRSLLKSDEDLLQHVRDHLASGRRSLEDLLGAVRILFALQTCLFALQQQVKSTLLVDALAGILRESTFEKNLFLHLKRSNSTALRDMLAQLVTVTTDELHETCQSLLQELDDLMAEQKDGGAPLRSEEDIQNSTLRTTVVAKKVELSKQKSTLTKSDAAYSDILRRFVETLQSHLEAKLIDPKNLVFSEVFIYDLKSPHRDVFTPKPRMAIERALASPHDYLDCSCCASGADVGDDSTLASTQPATAILYQLYLESGAMINAADLRTAFMMVLGEERDEVETSALFQRSLAELRHLGLVRGTRKKADHITKMAWKGL